MPFKPQVEEPNCAICLEKFDSHDRVPFIRECNHSVCSQCISLKVQACKVDCRQDAKQAAKIERLNRPLLAYCAGQLSPDTSWGDSVYDKIELNLALIGAWAGSDLFKDASPQMKRKILNLVQFAPPNPENCRDIQYRLARCFDRLLLELIQAHYHSRRREQDFMRLVKRKGCTLRVPGLVDKVIERLLRLYRAADHLKDQSFERDALKGYLQMELADMFERHEIERTLQTLYWSGVFDILEVDSKPCRLKLKEELANSADSIRQKLNEKMIQLALDNRIRLTPESFTFVLYGSASHETLISRVQAVLSHLKTPVTVNELEQAIRETHDKLGLQKYTNDLADMEMLCIRDDIDTDSLLKLVTLFVGTKDLLVLRQLRKKVSIEIANRNLE